MQALPEPASDSRPPYWDYWRHDLWSRVTRGEDPGNFPTWPSIFHTMLQDHWPAVIAAEKKRLEEWGYPLWKLHPPHLGPHDTNAFDESRNLIHQCYALAQWEQASGRKVRELDTIVEFGGGYGAMALICRRLGFSGRYYIIDLPEFALLQQYYLTACWGTHDIFWVSAQELIDEPVDLLIALYSLSEMPIEERGAVLTALSPHQHLLLYSNRFEHYDNVAYFQGYATCDADRWRHYKAEHMPPESWYSINA